MPEIQIKLNIAKKTGKAILDKDGSQIAYIDFINERNQLRLTDFYVTKKGYKKRGYGTILIHALMGWARAKRKPIILFSLIEAMLFYEKLGFIHLRKFKKGSYRGIKLNVGNLNPKYTFLQQVGTEDFIWIPSNMKEAFIFL